MRLLVTSALGLALVATVPTPRACPGRGGRSRRRRGQRRDHPPQRAEQAQQRLPDQYRQVLLHAIFDPLLDQVIGGKLLVAEAERQKLQETPTVQQQLALARDEVLRNGLLQATVDKEVTEEKVRAARGRQDAAWLCPGGGACTARPGRVRGGGAQDYRRAGERCRLRRPCQGALDRSSAKDNAGDLGYFAEAGVPEFAEAAFTMELGTISKDPARASSVGT